MQEVIHRCDYPVRGAQCGDAVPDNKPTTFALEAVSYEMDLCAKHKEQFESALKPYLTIAEPLKARAGKAVRQALKGRGGATFTTKDVRRWLQEQGREVSPTGRIPNAQIEEYRVAMQL